MTKTKKYLAGLVMSGLAARAKKHIPMPKLYRNHSSTSSTLTKLLVGAGIGAAAAMLATPTTRRGLWHTLADRTWAKR